MRFKRFVTSVLTTGAGSSTGVPVRGVQKMSSSGAVLAVRVTVKGRGPSTATLGKSGRTKVCREWSASIGDAGSGRGGIFDRMCSTDCSG